MAEIGHTPGKLHWRTARSSSLDLRPEPATAVILRLWRCGNARFNDGSNSGVCTVAPGAKSTDAPETCSELLREGAGQKGDPADAGRQTGSHRRMAGWQYPARKLGRSQYRNRSGWQWT